MIFRKKKLLNYFILLNVILCNPINYNLDLISHTQITNASNDYGTSDVWGYTDETGIEYAIIGYQFGIKR